MKKELEEAGGAPEVSPDTELADIIRLYPETRRVSVRRLSDDTQRWVRLGAVPGEVFSDEYIQQKFGGGVYQFHFHNSAGEIKRSVTNIEIADLPEGERGKPTPAAIAPAVNLELDLLRRELDRRDRHFSELIASMKETRAGGGGSITELVTALVSLQGMVPQPAKPAGLDELIAKTFDRAFDLAIKISNPPAAASAEPKNEWLGLFRDVLTEARPLLAQLNAPAKPAKPAPVVDLSGLEVEGEEETEVDLTPALTFIKNQLRGGSSPAFLVELVSDQMRGNVQLAEIVAGVVSQPIEEIIALDTELAEEPMRTKFGQFFGALSARHLPSDSGNTERVAGD